MLPTDRYSVLKRIRKILDDPTQGKAIRDDLRGGLDALPVWMRNLVTKLLQDADESHATARKSPSASSHAMLPVTADRSMNAVLGENRRPPAAQDAGLLTAPREQYEGCGFPSPRGNLNFQSIMAVL